MEILDDLLINWMHNVEVHEINAQIFLPKATNSVFYFFDLLTFNICMKILFA